MSISSFRRFFILYSCTILSLFALCVSRSNLVLSLDLMFSNFLSIACYISINEDSAFVKVWLEVSYILATSFFRSMILRALWMGTEESLRLFRVLVRCRLLRLTLLFLGKFISGRATDVLRYCLATSLP